MARTYVAWLKSRSKRAATVTALKANMQKTLVKELWDRIECRQEELVDKTIARRTLDQSRYEKQMVTKLCEVRNQMSIMTENQKILENMTATANEVEYRAIHERVKDVASRRQKDLEIECQRMCELRVRLREKKVQMLEEKHRNLCRETVLDILNLAMRIEDYRQMNDGIVPQTILREWTTKFVRGESLFDDDLPIGLTSGDSAEIDVSPILEESLRVKLEKAKVLRESLFDDYLESRPPWKQSSWLPAEDATETMELGRTVLGYVVHRLLNYIHPQSSDVETRALLPKPENIAIILGIMNPTMHESFRGLLDNTDVRLVRMEDAINYCLDRYKNESLDVEYIDASVIAATDEFVKSLESGKHRITCPAQRVSVSSKSDDGYSRRGRTSLLFRRSLVERTDGAKTSEKQTQTPRNIPHDDLDTMLTDSAFIGKCAYEFLALGQPITNDLATKILVEYLKTLDNTKGWAFIDYPNTYEQMSLLETALTGFKVPPDPEPLDFEHVTIEDIEPKSPRMVYEEEIDPSDHYRLSRLVPNPLKRIKDIVIPTFANLFVRVSQKPKNFELQDCSYERLSRNAPSVDKFYASREIGYFLYYTNLDRTTLKRLARLVVGEQLRGKSSEELFGDLPKSRERSKERNSVGSKAPVVRHMLSESSEDKDVSNEITEREEEAEIEMEEDEEEVGRGDYDLEQRRVRPGEENWEWIEFPLPSVLVEILSDLWQSMERCYVDDTKELLLLKSIHSSGIVPYKNFLTRNTAEFMKRPDNKQDLLHRFHLAFNAIDGDARHDEDIKCELHRRLADFQAELWEICDRRRHEAENERRRFIDEEWTVYETTVLFNVYVGLLQAELDRFVDTMHLLEDYYSAMLGKPLRDTRFAKVVLQRIQVGDVDPVFVHERSARFLQLDDAKSTTDRTETKRPKSKAGSVRTTVQVPHQAPSPPPPILDYILLRKEITDLLIDREARSRDLEEIRVFKAITENVRYARNIVDTLSATAIDFVEGENVAIPTDNDFTIDSNRGLDLALERRYAVAYEIDRIRQKLDSIAATAHTEFAFLLDTMRNSFHRIYDSILDRFSFQNSETSEFKMVESLFPTSLLGEKVT
ncbi:PREDICTED: sperm flagellar protein 2-like [Dufourea novaeangliae]|uniref:sperm flagellar protein 2-like n=1 Tax=Dufourea novaeangliae TaxID=178035 RepID=UPI000767674F|nr:PREDICTED: sperm flagellar protein 2-like [Dufourea novaeangliae]